MLSAIKHVFSIIFIIRQTVIFLLVWTFRCNNDQNQYDEQMLRQQWVSDRNTISCYG